PTRRRHRVQHDRVAVRPPARAPRVARGGGEELRRRRRPARHHPSHEPTTCQTAKGAQMSSMALPYLEPLVPREPGERQIPEPPRRGEPGGPPCAICAGKATSA